MDYALFSDLLWYFGHVLTGSSVIVHDNYYMAVSLVVIGQTITIISRPIGRIKNTSIVDIEDELHYNI
jgi:hypothetical protein